MLLRANVLLQETSGVRPVVAERLVELLNAQVHPVIPEQGSVGASGDLAPLAHLAYALMGEGEVLDDQGGSVQAASVLRHIGIEPLELRAKEGLAFINGTQVQTAVLALLRPRCRQPVADGARGGGHEPGGLARHSGALR